MATLCKNCAHALVFDPASQRMTCAACGSSFTPEEVEPDSKKFRQDMRARSMQDVYGTADDDSMDCYVYTCSQCAGEIIINGTEASTTCIYCGNSNVVFSRIARQKCPEFVLPFSITKEQVLQLVRNRISRGIFVPKEIKNFTVDCVRGIYIPYWIVNAQYTDAVVIEGQVKSGKNRVTRYFGRSGDMNIRLLPLDASTMLSDASSSKLEPFDLTKLKPFDEDYLAGFYSNVSDVTYSDLRSAVFSRTKEYFDEEAKADVKASSKKVISSCPSMKLNNDMIYAMLPAWFITFTYKGKFNTILVNGDTGKVVCGLPWNKKLFYTLLFVTGIIITIVLFFLLKDVLAALITTRTRSSSSRDGKGKMLAYIIAGIVALFSTGIHKVRKVIKNIKLTQDKDMFNFSKKRQG